VKPVALALAAFAVSFAADAADAVAFVADLQGSVTIEGDGKLNFLAELPAGTRLLLGTGSKVAVTYAASGAEFSIAGPGEFLVTATEVQAEKGSRPTRRTVAGIPDAKAIARISQTATASLRMRSLPGGAAKAGLQFPVDTRVATLEPVLRWRVERGAENLQVAVREASGKEIWKGGAPESELRVPVKLAPATRYHWTVLTANGSLGEAQFETLGAEALARAAKSRAAAKGFGDRVVHAMLLHDLGATQEAREAWAALARERPDLPELAALSRQ
jgi:hypothetical protein